MNKQWVWGQIGEGVLHVEAKNAGIESIILMNCKLAMIKQIMLVLLLGDIQVKCSKVIKYLKHSC